MRALPGSSDRTFAASRCISGHARSPSTTPSCTSSRGSRAGDRRRRCGRARRSSSLHGGPGFDQGYLRPGLRALADAHRSYSSTCADRAAPPRCRSSPARSSRWPTTSLRSAPPGHQATADLRPLRRRLRGPAARAAPSGLAGGLILCHTAARSLAALTRPAAGSRRAGRPRGRRCRGSTLRRRHVLRGPGKRSDASCSRSTQHPATRTSPPRLMALSTLNADIAAHFFQRLAPRLRRAPTPRRNHRPDASIIGRHDWVCPPAAGRALAKGIPGARLVESRRRALRLLGDPALFLRAVHEHLARSGAGVATEEPQAPDSRRAA